MSLAIPQNMQKIPSGSSRHPALELTTSYSDLIKPADGLMAQRVDGVRRRMNAHDRDSVLAAARCIVQRSASILHGRQYKIPER